MKKLISSTILIVILFNFIFVNNSYCDDDGGGGLSSKGVQNVLSDTTAYEAALNNSDEETRGTSIGNTILSIWMCVLNVIPLLARLIMGIIGR